MLPYDKVEKSEPSTFQEDEHFKQMHRARKAYFVENDSNFITEQLPDHIHISGDVKKIIKTINLSH